MARSRRPIADEAGLRRLLEDAGVRPTSQRLGLARLLFGGVDRHVVARDLYAEALQAGLGVSLATVYNTLGQFVQVGLLREVTIDAERTYFDTHVEPHGHVYDETTGALTDVALPVVELPPEVEPGQWVSTDVLIRVRSE